MWHLSGRTFAVSWLNYVSTHRTRRVNEFYICLYVDRGSVMGSSVPNCSSPSPVFHDDGIRCQGLARPMYV